MGDEDRTDPPILVIKDGTNDKGQPGRIRASQVPKKGGHPYAIHVVTQELRMLGYREVRVRTDQEKHPR